MNELSCSRRRACTVSNPLLQRAQSGMSSWLALKFKPRRGNAFRASHQVSEYSELFKKPEPGAQFQWERTSSAVQPPRSLRGSEAEPTTSSRYSTFRGRERSLDPEQLRKAVRHSQTNGASPFGLRRPLALESDLRRGKVLLAFCLHTTSLDRDRPKYASLSARQWFFRSVVIIASTLNADLSTDHRSSASPE